MVHGEPSQSSVEPSSSRSLLNTPPPPYKDAGSSLVLAETTTRTEVVTTTTTHFFSLPLWRRRAQTSRPTSTYESKSPRQSSTYEPKSSLNISEDGVLSPLYGFPRSGSLMLEKALPPIPPPQPNTNVEPPVSSRSLPSLSQSTEAIESRPLLSLAHPPSRSPRLYSSPSTSQTALAQASLGVTFPHILPSGSSSTAEVNTIAFVTSPASPTDPAPSPSRLRRTKSSQKLKSSPTPDKLSVEDVNERRRTRGFSFGPSSFLHFATPEAKSKGKEKAVEPPVDTQPTSGTLSRKGSFWSRKKSLTSADDHPRPTTSVLELPPLPPVQPLSPLTVNLELAPNSGPPTSRSLTIPARGLTRSFSERRNSKYAEQSSVMTYSPVILAESPQSPSPTSPLPINIDSSHLHDPEKSPQRSDAPNTRPRANTNPPLLRRLSFNMLSHGNLQTPPSKSTSVSPTSSSPSSSRPSLEKRRPVIPRPLSKGDSPSMYLDRLLAAISRAEVAGILASNTDAFHVQALHAYLDRFDFVDDPLDIALRKLLMDTSLPRETQQIDRVIEAFAGRYLRCNPALFTSEDQPYILAFSLIMLHTDAFNKSNKRKMTKADYIKNTRLPGVAPETLDCFYDNIVFAPFIFIEDPVDGYGQRGLPAEGSSSRLNSPAVPSNPGTGTGSSLLGKGNKVDPYHLIANNLLGALRVDVEAFIPLKDPLSIQGTAGAVDQALLHQAFARAQSVEIFPHETRANSFHSMSPGGIPSPILASPIPRSREIFILKLIKVGVMERKDDLLESGRKASNRRWKPYSVLLTGSQLLFCKDTNWAAIVLHSLNSSHGTPLSLRPDELISLKDAIAVYDRSYTKHEHTLRFATADGRQMLLRARNENEMNEWISRINYASTFKSHGVRMRSLGMSGRDIQLTGIAAATSHLHDLQHLAHTGNSTTRLHRWDSDAPENLMMMLTGSPEVISPPSSRGTSEDVPVAPEIEGAEQFKATFDQVKADLAAGRWPLADLSNKRPSRSTTPIPRQQVSVPLWDETPPLLSRSQIIQSKIRDLDSKISAVQIQLDADIRFLRNVATMTPFQKATRDRLTTSIQPVVKRLKQIRIEMARLTCHHDILSKDMELETQDWKWAHEMALKAATDTLQTRHKNRTSRSRPAGSPVSPMDSSSAPPTARPESSASESFHSAVDFGSDSEEQSIRDSDPDYCESPKPSSSESLPACSFPPSDQDESGDISARTSVESQLHERFYTAPEELPEEAEAWNKTRGANRVSLVRIPSDMGLSRHFSKHRTERPFA